MPRTACRQCSAPRPRDSVAARAHRESAARAGPSQRGSSAVELKWKWSDDVSDRERVAGVLLRYGVAGLAHAARRSDGHAQHLRVPPRIDRCFSSGTVVLPRACGREGAGGGRRGEGRVYHCRSEGWRRHSMCHRSLPRQKQRGTPPPTSPHTPEGEYRRGVPRARRRFFTYSEFRPEPIFNTNRHPRKDLLQQEGLRRAVHEVRHRRVGVNLRTNFRPKAPRRHAQNTTRRVAASR